ncbi:hypothetical protein RN001_005566 [Aquatica leii]|uniref:Uncharacterized protein n=1 Tax=Aquatica leii TaxID=1421715 RepID=A0AAN7Q1G6_9COLE|nr:hypothetical protein RN001_005566 [Aquatica leii]
MATRSGKKFIPSDSSEEEKIDNMEFEEATYLNIEEIEKDEMNGPEIDKDLEKKKDEELDREINIEQDVVEGNHTSEVQDRNQNFMQMCMQELKKNLRKINRTLLSLKGKLIEDTSIIAKANQLTPRMSEKQLIKYLSRHFEDDVNRRIGLENISTTKDLANLLKHYDQTVKFKNYSNVWNNRNSDSAWNREEQRNSPYNNDFRRGNFVRYRNWNRDHYDNHRKEREDDRNRGQRNPETNYRNYERDNKEKEDRGNNYRTFDKVCEGKTYRNNNVIRGRGGTQARGRGGYTGYVHNVNVIEQQNAINVVEEDSDDEASKEKSCPSQDTKPRGMYVSQQDFQ